MKFNVFIVLLSISLILFGCSNDDDQMDMLELDENEFKVQPSQPDVNDIIKVITYGCAYNNLAYIIKEDFNIEVVKHFNGAMKQPCILEYDTISLGQLASGTYQLTFTIVDISNMTLGNDTIFHTETKQLIVDN